MIDFSDCAVTQGHIAHNRSHSAHFGAQFMKNERQDGMMKRRSLFIALLLIAMAPSALTGSVTAQDIDEEARQPTKENATYILYGSGDTQSAIWGHFSDNDTETADSYSETVDNGQLNVNMHFDMDPQLARFFEVDMNETISGFVTIDLQFDTSDNAPEQGPLTIALYNGDKKVDEMVWSELTTGTKQYYVNFNVTDDTKFWAPGNNIRLDIECDLESSNTGGIFGVGNQPIPAEFEIFFKKGQSELTFPILTLASSEEDFQLLTGQIEEESGGNLLATIGIVVGVLLILGVVGTNVATFLGVRGTEFEDEEEAAYWKKQALIPIMGPVKWFLGGNQE